MKGKHNKTNIYEGKKKILFKKKREFQIGSPARNRKRRPNGKKAKASDFVGVGWGGIDSVKQKRGKSERKKGSTGNTNRRISGLVKKKDAKKTKENRREIAPEIQIHKEGEGNSTVVGRGGGGAAKTELERQLKDS